MPTNRKFFVCPLGKDDPDKCKYFKWADELQSPNGAASRDGASTASIVTAAQDRYSAAASRGGQSFGGAGQALGGGSHTLGQSPQAQYGRPAVATTPTAARVAPMTPQTGTRIVRRPSEEEDIDWDKVDTDELERAAIASTPGSSQSHGTRAETLQDRLLAVPGSEGVPKRKREEEDTPRAVDRTPKRATTGGEDVSLVIRRTIPG